MISGKDLPPTPTTPTAVSTKPTSNALRLRGSKFFLTYPRCYLSPSECLEQLKTMPFFRDMVGWIVAREEHADGGLHLHCYLEVPSRVDNKVDPSTFDLTSCKDEWFHPNIQACRSPKYVKAYVTKGADYVTNLNLEESLRDKVSVTWKRARETAREEGLEAGLAILRDDDRTARDLCMAGDRITKNLLSETRKKLKIVWGLESFSWTMDLWDPSTRATTLILTGKTDVGKTALAKALMPEALFISHMDGLRQYDSRYDGIIFDDMTFTHMHREAQIHLVDVHEDRQIHVRYSIAELPAGTNRIITTNQNPEFVVAVQDPAIARRVTIVEVAKVAGIFVFTKKN